MTAWDSGGSSMPTERQLTTANWDYVDMRGPRKKSSRNRFNDFGAAGLGREHEAPIGSSYVMRPAYDEDTS